MDVLPFSVKANTAPSIPNPVDQLEVTQGTLFRYQVPEDTFHDEEDGATRMLNLNLLDISRQPLDPHSWLQFDVPNQEFYGLPLEADVGTQVKQKTNERQVFFILYARNHSCVLAVTSVTVYQTHEWAFKKRQNGHTIRHLQIKSQ